MNIEINNWEYEDDVDEQQFYFSSKLNDDVIGCIIIPHDGNDNMWLMRIGFRSTFDKWGNVEVQEKFLTLDKLKEVMSNLANIDKKDFDYEED